MFLVSCGALENRIDPNFYRIDFQEIKEKITKNNFKKLGYLVDFSSETWNGKDYFNHTFPYIEISEIDILSGIIQNISQVPVNEAPSRAKMIVKNNDILVSTTRPNRGAISFVKLQENEIQIASTGFAILRNIKQQIISKEFLFFCLRQEFSLKQMEQRSSGGNYPAITTEELKNVLIPIPPLDTQNQIVQLFAQAYESKKAKEAEAKRLLAGIDAYLLEQLGIKTEKTENKKSFFVKFSQVQGKRFDPFYHKTEFEELEKSLRNGKYKMHKIKDIANFQAGYAFNANDYVENSNCHLVTIKNISKNEINLDNSTYLPNDFFDKFPLFQIKQNDLLIAMTGATIGKVGLFNSDKKALLNQRNGIIRSNQLNYLYLMSILNTDIYQKFILRNSNGGAQPNISETDIMRIEIPLPPLSLQTEIAEHIQGVRAAAKRLENEAKEEVEKAKREVERLILGV